MIAQSSRASPGAKPARLPIWTRPSVLTQVTGLFGIGRTRQDDVGAMRAFVAMRTDIDGEACGLAGESISSAPSRNSTSVLSQHFGSRLAPLTRHEAEIETTDTRGGGVKNGKTIPVCGDGANGTCELGGCGQNRSAIRPGNRALADDDHRTLRLSSARSGTCPCR